EFVAVLSNEPQGGLAMRHRGPSGIRYARQRDFYGWGGHSGGSFFCRSFARWWIRIELFAGGAKRRVFPPRAHARASRLPLDSFVVGGAGRVRRGGGTATHETVIRAFHLRY